MGGAVIHPLDMTPDLSMACFPFDRFACLPLLFRDLLHMAIAMLIQPLVTHKNGLDDGAMRSRRDHRQVLHVQIDGHGDQVGIALGLHNLFRDNGLFLWKMDLRLLLEHQFGSQGDAPSAANGLGDTTNGIAS